ncbi:MAG: hypothetical protein WKG03_01910 [Telluria sp.]
MELSKNGGWKWVGVTGGIGALMLACLACCLPLVTPLLAWLGVAALGFMGPIGLVAALFGAAAIVSVIMLRRRRTRCRDCAPPG